jgi:aminoglycoside phosphotransferase (APT) family kinase protein
MSGVQDPALRASLRGLFGAVADLETRAHPLQSSCALTEVALRDATGTRHELLLKAESCRSPEAGPAFLYDDRRELAAYLALAEHGLTLPRLLGASVDAEASRCWLFLEPVEGTPLWQWGDPRAWFAAAEWLADLHASRPVPEGPPWLHYDEGFFAVWMERALAFAPDAGLGELAEIHASAAARLSAAPQVILHGDYYPSNVLVCGAGVPRVCPLDLELAGVGAAALDLAALSAGLPEPLSAGVLDAYEARLSDGSGRDELEELLLCARLHLAIRWLGWMPSRRPPPHQRFDWVAEANAAARALKVRPAKAVPR